MTPLTIIRSPRSLFQATPPRQRRGGGLSVARFIIVAVAIVASCQASPLQAQLRDWTNTSNSNAYYHVFSNWDPIGAPGPTDTARFQQSGNYGVWWNFVTASSVSPVGKLEVLHGNVTLLNPDISPQHEVIVNGSGGAGSFNDLGVYGAGALTFRGLHLRSLGGAQVFNGGTLTLDGSHSAGTRMSVEGSTGFRVLGNGVNVLAGSVLHSTQTLLHGGTATVSGNGSQWNTSNALRVGDSTSVGGPYNFRLDVMSGGLVTSGTGFIGKLGSGTVNVNGVSSRWNNVGTLWVGESDGTGALNILAGGQVTSGNSAIAVGSSASGTVVVTGAGSKWMNDAHTYIGFNGTGTLNIEAGGEVTDTDGFVGRNFGGTGTVNVTGAGSKWSNSRFLDVGSSGIGTLNVSAGGEVTNNSGILAKELGSLGTATITGEGSKWMNSGSLVVGNYGRGTLNIQAGGKVTNTDGVVGQYVGFAGGSEANITGTGSKWTNSGFLIVGDSGTGTLNVLAGGEVTNTNGAIGRFSGSSGTVTVTGAGSKWLNSGFLTIGEAGTGSLSVQNSGLVIVGGNTTISSTGSVNLNGGRFEFGTTDQNSFRRINAVSGSLAGNVNLSGLNAASSFAALSNNSVDSSGVNLVNTGMLYGNGLLGSRVTNQSSGEIRAGSGEWLRFGGTGNSNAGRINNFGGVVEFGGSLTNAAGGFITGRGQYIAGGGWTNQGNMAFSGTTDIVGDVANMAGSLIVNSAGATTTFYDDVVNNGQIRTSPQGRSVFFGAVSGAGNYTGTGTVYFEGDLNPGNSPGSMSFGGDLVLGSSASTLIELGGLNIGDFDQLLVQGDLFLSDSQLEVALWDGFTLSNGMEFLVADVEGNLLGQFSGLGEGSLVGNFGGTDLFITYNGFGGNGGVGLFTSAVPEPSGLALVGVLSVLGLCRRRRRGQR
jgi:fibronectin-binding autotransporter adhesin